MATAIFEICDTFEKAKKAKMKLEKQFKDRVTIFHEVIEGKKVYTVNVD